MWVKLKFLVYTFSRRNELQAEGRFLLRILVWIWAKEHIIKVVPYDRDSKVFLDTKRMSLDFNWRKTNIWDC